MQKPGQLYPNGPCVSTGRERIPKESIIESVNQSISEWLQRDWGVVIIEGRGRRKPWRKNHAVMKKCTSKCGRKERLFLTSSFEIVVVGLVQMQKRRQKERALANVPNQSPLSDICPHGQSRQSLKRCPGLCCNGRITGQIVERMDRRWKMLDGWLDEREEGWAEHWREFYSTFSTFPESRSLYLNKCSGCPQGLVSKSFGGHGRVRWRI